MRYAIAAFGMSWVLIFYVLRELSRDSVGGLCGPEGCRVIWMMVGFVIVSLPLAAAIGIAWAAIHFIRKKW